MLVDEALFQKLVTLLGDDIDSLVAQFVEQGQQLLIAIDKLSHKAALDQAAIELLSAELHKLKGSALSLHCSALVSQCDRLSNGIKNGDTVLFELDNKMAFEQCVEQTCVEIRRLAQQR